MLQYSSSALYERIAPSFMTFTVNDVIYCSSFSPLSYLSSFPYRCLYNCFLVITIGEIKEPWQDSPLNWYRRKENTIYYWETINRFICIKVAWKGLQSLDRVSCKFTQYWQKRAVAHLQVKTFTDDVIGRPRKGFHLTSCKNLPKIFFSILDLSPKSFAQIASVTFPISFLVFPSISFIFSF